MSIELICFGMLKSVFVNSYCRCKENVKKKPQTNKNIPNTKTQHVFLVVLSFRICTGLLTFRQESAWIAPKSSIKFSFQSVTPVKQHKNGR